MSGISLTASMRSNLLSLQNIARQQDIVQNRLATGLKVSSAIDNPSSYYTASSLNNRAADLTALLDAISQGIQTIKAASEAIESGTKFLEQAKAVANQALETAQPVIARVSSEAELLAAVDSGQRGLIVITADIDNISSTLKLHNGQSLVGASYLDKNAATTKLTFNFDAATEQNGIEAGNNSLIAGLAIDFTSTYDSQTFVAAIYADNVKNVKVQDIRLDITSKSTSVGFYGVFGIMGINGAEINVSGYNQIDLSDYRSIGIFAHRSSKININGQTDFAYKTDKFSWGIWSHSQSTININSDAVLNCDNTSFSNNTLILNSAAFINIRSGASLSMNIGASGGKFRVVSNEYGPESGQFKEGNGLLLEKGVNLSVKYAAENIDFSGIITKDLIINQTSQIIGNPNDYPDNIVQTGTALNYTATINNEAAPDRQYNSILWQYNILISDASYKGINLLEGQYLKINFNEDRSSKIEIAGVKADSESLGLKTKVWKTAKDVEKSISELEEAIGSLRSFASEFGNYYSIVTTRQDFTENLINVLEEGADKLTLADMNQESANMLALQTAQQLAVNSLSLASQASQAVLRLF